MLEDELNKIGDHVGKVENQQALEEQKLAASSKKLAVKQAALATSEAHRADLQEQLRTQDLSAADVERIAQDRGRLRQQLAAAEEAKEELHSRTSRARIALASAPIVCPSARKTSSASSPSPATRAHILR